ncbi:hypothetical protein M427DRAFT_55410 [Gonapodya prolifera JEL478]|uniref:TLC domain-containing protein n=1 Tax=Gonapodya prolifera (strain JEL478) TaxID=1344416 RepID=A0A139AJ14_GONPJ|nr:hypothetical protein M427DRAFT_55410 [Gonapodya prolifera JEL478]|eukprot:KXS16453.1 hypothetical protein M427DRAFT_55410 [Gonapodya prolifera JEL478]
MSTTTALPTVCSLENPTYTSPTWVAVNYLVFLLILYVVTRCSGWFLKRVDRKRWKAFSEEIRVNVISYLVQIIVTSTALAIQLATLPLLSPTYAFSVHELQVSRSAVNIVSLLYVSELIFRRKMRISLVTHHITTVGIIILLVCAFETTFDLTMPRIGMGFLYQATLEQVTFVGLLLYRYRPHTRATYITLLLGAAVPMVLKLVSLGYVVVVWAKYVVPVGLASPAYVAVDIILPIAAFILLTTQIWSAHVVYKLALRSKPGSSSGLNSSTRSRSRSRKSSLSPDAALSRDSISSPPPVSPTEGAEKRLLDTVWGDEKWRGRRSRSEEEAADVGDVGDIGDFTMKV